MKLGAGQTAAIWSAALLAVACGGDDVVEGSRAECGFGGALNVCEPAERTPTAACTRLVECGVISLDRPEEYQFDWAACVDRMSEYDEGSRRLVINCIATSTCDQLGVQPDPE